MADQDKPKIIVDDDWKAQAQAEKEKLAEQVEQPAKQEIPPADFPGLVNALMTNIVFALGGMEDPQTHRRYVDLEMAKHYIDLLAVLEQKTANNLTPDEKKLLDAAIYETRMAYVQMAQRAMTAAAGGPPPAAGGPQPVK